MFFRDNVKGIGFERWHHRYGCGLWFNIARDTVSHRILAVYGMTDPRPALENEA
jgi:sarcosine oxidase, subunit delta